MYIVRNKKTKKFIHTNPASLNEKLKGKEVYPKFNSKTMEILKTGNPAIPEHYKVDKKGYIRELTLKEKFDAGLLSLEPNQKVKNNEIVTKTTKELVKEGLIIINEPFEYLSSDNKILERTVEEALKAKLIKTFDQCEKALNLLNGEIERKISEKYQPGYEMKLMKDYMAWVDEGKPKSDGRDRKYLEMQTYVDSVKTDYKPTRVKIKKIMSDLQKAKN